MKTTAVIIPAYNEANHIYNVVLRARHNLPDADVYVVNDASKDKTLEQAQKAGAKVIDLKTNHGKGSAARKGCDLAYNKNYRNFILMDADGQHRPEDAPKLLAYLEKADIIFTHRVGGKQPLLYKIGNWGLNILHALLFGIHAKDTQSGFKAFNRKAYKQIRWKSNRFAIESEIVIRAKGLRYRDIPIQKIYEKHHKGQGKGTNVKTGFHIAGKLFEWRIIGVGK